MKKDEKGWGGRTAKGGIKEGRISRKEGRKEGRKEERLSRKEGRKAIKEGRKDIKEGRKEGGISNLQFRGLRSIPIPVLRV